MGSHPRIYRLHHKCLSHNHKFEISNNNDQIEYVVHSNSLLFNNEISLCDASNGKELIKINKEKNHLHVRYDISQVNDNNQHLATVKAIHDQHHSQIIFEIDSIYGVYQVEYLTSQFDHQFKLTTGNQILVNVTKNINSSEQKNIYDIQIHGDDDGGDRFLLSLVIAIWYAKRWYHI